MKKPDRSTDKHPKKSGRDLIIVGIGASAGGLDALQKMLPGLPSQEGMAYVVAQHLAPKYRSMLGNLLTKHTSLPIEIVRDGIVVGPDKIYITPPNKDVSFSNGRLTLSDASPIGPKPSIDYFFTSLAEGKGPQAVGVILSGTGTDGAHGIRAIKSNDGITIAQTVETAKFDGMPSAAIQTGNVDLILPPDRIGPELESALKYPHLLSNEKARESHMDEISEILGLLGDRTETDFSGYKSSTMYRRISRRMVLHKLHSFADYVQYVKENPEELDTLYKDLLISVTSFFRDVKAFEALSKSLQEKLKGKQPNDAIRIWVPACSSGEEAYSIAILLAEILGRDVGKYRIQIFATDIDKDSVQRARIGSYPLATVMDTYGGRFDRYFTHSDNTVTIKKELRDMVVLARQDLLKDTPFLHLDLISCRNLLIYLENELQEKLLSLFHFSLDPDGLLFLGKSESIRKKPDLFSTVDSKWKIFKRKETLVNRMPHLVQNPPRAKLPMIPTAVRKQEKNELWKEREFATSLLNITDCSAIITDEQGNINYIRGDVSAYMRLPEGSVGENLNAVAMAREEIRYTIQSLLHRSKKENRIVTGQEIKLEEEEHVRTVRIQAGPISDGAEPQFMVVFSMLSDRKGPNGEQDAGATEDGDETRIAELTHELAATREHLQDTVEELETSSEELQSLNEELQSANEELQASNEELETSNEELQASNEELNTVNEELRVKSDDLARALTELEGSEKRYRLLVDHMNEALMVCEMEYGQKQRPTDLIIRQANNALEKLIGIDLKELPLRAGQANMPELAKNEYLERFVHIAKTGEPQQMDLRLEHLNIDLVLSVYHLDSGLLGVVCHDDTQRKRHDAALKASEARYRELVQNANSAIIRWKVDGSIVFFNEYAQRFFGYKSDEIVGKHIGILLPDRDTYGKDMTELVDKIASTPDRFMNFENENLRGDGSRVWMTWTNKPVLDEKGNTKEILAVGTDMTERKKAEDSLEELNKTLEAQVKKRTAELEKTIRALKKEALNRQKMEAEVHKLSKVFMDASDPIIIEDVHHTITNLNLAAEKAYGFTRRELIGKPVSELVPPEILERALELRRRCIRGETVHNWESLRQGRNDTPHPVLITAFSLHGAGEEPESLVTIAKDITEYKVLQEEVEKRARQLAKLTNELTLAEQRERYRLAKILHDNLQQLLAGAKLKLETLAMVDSVKDNPDLNSALELILESLKTSRTLASELSPPVLFQHGLMQALTWLAKHMKKSHDLSVEIFTQDDREIEQEEIKILLFESVRELLFNIVKHTDEKSARVELSHDEASVKIIVSDDGPGIDPTIQEDQGEEMGGFGLFTIRERLQLLDGTFEVKSKIGSGTAITMTLPLKSSDYATPESDTSGQIKHILAETISKRPKSRSGKKISLMLVDDHAVMRDGLSTMLSNHPDIRIVGEASNGEQAVTMARKLQPDIILMDINMPKMNGIEATRIIHAEQSHIGIIALSVHDADDQAEEIISAGAVAYQQKSGSSKDLLKTILEVAKNKKSK